MMERKALAEAVSDARQRTLDLVADLDDEQMLGPRLGIVNPLLWEIGHVAWFQEKWTLRHVCGEPSCRGDADALYDSIAIPHDTRWDLPLPSRKETLAYMRSVCDRVLEKLDQPDPSGDLRYFARYTTLHEDMHGEAFTYTRQTLGYAAPGLNGAAGAAYAPEAGGDGSGAGKAPEDIEIPGGAFMLGAGREESFVFDNEKWSHLVRVKPFAIARTPVTQIQFLSFVASGGYQRRELWSEEGWRWRSSADAAHPLYWRREGAGSWLRRNFNQWVPLEPNKPVIHVNVFEAEAYCRWAGRRLPTEAEWEVAAGGEPGPERALSARKRRFPWGDAVPSPRHGNLDSRALGCVDVDSCPEGDSAFGCRQMIGNVWEWTASPFLPYPGFTADAYKEYSEPWFRTHRVLRGGCWATRSRLLRNTYRNFYTPERRDVWAGFRTCRSTE